MCLATLVPFQILFYCYAHYYFCYFNIFIVKHNQHTINCVYGKCLNLKVLTYLYTCEKITTIKIKNICKSKEFPATSCWSLPPISLSHCFWETSGLHSFTLNWFVFTSLVYKLNDTICILLSDFFHSAKLFWDSSLPFCVSVAHPFLLPNSIPLQGYTIICLSIHLLMDIWVLSSYWLL